MGYYKLPAAQTAQENCVAHNGSLIPVPGRDIMAQAWYQGGVSLFDFTDPAHPREIAYFDRGPIDSTKLVRGGYWAAYYYNGYLYGSEKVRGLDIQTDADGRSHAERDRRREPRALRRAQRADPAQNRLARRIPRGARLRRPISARPGLEHRPDVGHLRAPSIGPSRRAAPSARAS